MIIKYVTDIADQMGIKLSRVSIVDQKPVGCTNAFLLNISLRLHSVNAIVFNSDLGDIENGDSTDKLDARIRAALSRLKMLVEP